MALPASSKRFAEKKAAILAQLAQPEDEYSDASPKGAVDEGVRPLLAAINQIDGFVTTSSCAGRVAVFLEGQRQTDEGGRETASAGGKGGGGTWLYVTHDPLFRSSSKCRSSYESTDWASVFGLVAGGEQKTDTEDERLVHFKFEPLILHVATASLAHAQLLLRCALEAGFRESGAVGLDGGEDGAMPMVAVRSMGLALAAVVGIGGVPGDGNCERGWCIVSPNYLARLAYIADQRFVANRERTERFERALAAAMAKEAEKSAADASGSGHERLRGKGRSKPGWEDAATRRARLQAEGRQRQAALQKEQEEKTNKDAGDMDEVNYAWIQD